MNRLRAYELGMLVGLEKSGGREAFLQYAKKLAPLMKAAVLLRKRGKSSPKLNKLAAWYDHIVPVVAGGMEKRAIAFAALLPFLGKALGFAGLSATPWLGSKLYNWWTKPKEEAFALSPQVQKLLQSSGLDPELLAPIKLPEGISEKEQQYLRTYGIDLPTLLYRKRIMEKQKAEAEKQKSEAKLKATTPIGLSEYFKQRPMLQYVMANMPRQRPQPPRRPSYYGRYPRRPWEGVPRYPMDMDPSSAERGFWKKHTGGTPAEMRADYEATRVANIRRQQSEDLTNRFRQSLGV